MLEKTNGQTMGQMFRSKRLQMGLTQDVLAAQAGVSKPYLSLLETDRFQNPSDSVILWLCEALQLDADELRASKYLNAIPRELWPRVGRMIVAEQFKARAQAAANS